jgi:hypothetical protein
MLAKFFDEVWGWADYRLKDWSNASYKRGYTPLKADMAVVVSIDGGQQCLPSFLMRSGVGLTIGQRRSSRISLAMLVRESRTS